MKAPAKPARPTEAKAFASKKRNPKFDPKPLEKKKGKGESKLELFGSSRAKTGKAKDK